MGIHESNILEMILLSGLPSRSGANGFLITFLLALAVFLAYRAAKPGAMLNTERFLGFGIPGWIVRAGLLAFAGLSGYFYFLLAFRP